jgi:hypothetical protein
LLPELEIASRSATAPQGVVVLPDGTRELLIAMPYQFPVFEVVLKRRGRKWSWSVCTSEGDVVVRGSESSRPAANYKADRALFFLLLTAPYRSIRLSVPPQS